jgi:hypothetical protein
MISSHLLPWYVTLSVMFDDADKPEKIMWTVDSATAQIINDYGS